MPDRNDPHALPLDTVEEPVRRDDDFPIRKVWELWYQPARLRMARQPAERPFGPVPHLARRRGVVTLDVDQRRQKLKAARGCESDLHLDSRVSKASASTKTSSRS